MSAYRQHALLDAPLEVDHALGRTYFRHWTNQSLDALREAAPGRRDGAAA